MATCTITSIMRALTCGTTSGTMFCNSEVAVQNAKSASTAGILSCVGLVCSWTGILGGPRLIPADWVPYVWFAALIVLLFSTVLGSSQVGQRPNGGISWWRQVY